MERRLLGLVILIVLVSSIASYLLPLLALPLSVGLVVGGVLVRRQSRDAIVRSIALASILAGAILFIEIALLTGYLLSTLAVRTGIFRKDFVPTPP